MNIKDNNALKSKIRERMRESHFYSLSDDIRKRIRANYHQENQQDKSPLKHFIEGTKSIADEVLNDN